MKSNRLYDHISQNDSLRIDLNYAQEFGNLLKSMREGKGLSIHEVANALVLSDQQIKCLEMADTKGFYGLRFFVTALRKYADYSRLPINIDMLVLEGLCLVGTAPNCHSKVDQPSTASTISRIVNPSNVNLNINTKRNYFKTKSPSRWIVSLAIALVAIVPLLNYMPLSSWFSKNNAVSELKVKDPNKSPSSKAEKEPETRHYQNEIVMSFVGKSWVQSIFLDGRVIEKTYSKNDTEKINLAQLKSLTIGNVPVTTLKVNGKSLDPEILKIKTRDSVMKLTGEDLRSFLAR